MFVAEKFVFIHIPKTGGQKMLRVLENHEMIFRGTPARFHMNVNNVKHPGYSNDKPTLAFVRNPWSWYASWYHFCLHSGKVVLFDVITNGKQNDFITSINNLFDMIEGKRDDLVEKYNNQIPNVNHPIETLKDNFHQLSEWDCGLLSWNYFYLIFGDKANINYENVTIGKQEYLDEDALAFFVDNGIIENDSDVSRKQQMYDIIERAFTSGFKVNVTRDYGDFHQYYDDKLVERVYKKEQYIVDRYGYEFA